MAALMRYPDLLDVVDDAETLAVVDDMKLVGDGRSDLGAGDPQIEFLTANPEVAEELGLLAETMLESFAAAYPGETRTRRYANESWQSNGFEYVAAVNRLMGRSAS